MVRTSRPYSCSARAREFCRLLVCSLAMSRLAVVCPNFHRPDESEQIIPMVDDQLGLDGLGEQWSGVRVAGAPGRSGAEAVELESTDVSDARGELQAGEVEDRERGESLAGGVGGVLGDRQVGRVAEDLIEDGHGFAPRGG